MRPAGRINKVLSRIRRIWKNYPDLRLMQLLGNAIPDGGFDPYHMEDDELLERLDTTYPRGETDIISGFEPEVGGSNPSEGATSDVEFEVSVSDEDLDIETIRDLLSLVGYDVPDFVIRTWGRERQREVADWASAYHLEASDNVLYVPERPHYLDGYETDV